MKIERKLIAYISLFLLITVKTYAQNERTKTDYLIAIEQFYECLYTDSVVTMNDCSPFIDWHVAEGWEGYLFGLDCAKKHINDKDCGLRSAKYYNNPRSPSVYFSRIKEHKNELTQGLNKNEMFGILKNSSNLIDRDIPSSVLIKISFPNKKDIYFVMDAYVDEPMDIGSIFLPDGSDLDNKILFVGEYKKKKMYLEIPGKIIDPDGYVNVRKDTSAKSPVIGTIKVGEKFDYIPNSNSFWWKVGKKDTITKRDDMYLFKGYVYRDRIAPDKK